MSKPKPTKQTAGPEGKEDRWHGQAPLISRGEAGWMSAHITSFNLYDNPILRVLSSYIDRKTEMKKGILKTHKKPFFPRTCSVLAELKPVASAPPKHAGGLGCWC